MGNLWIKVNYVELSEKMKKVEKAVYELEEFLDDAGASQTTQPGACERENCSHRIGEK
jgi:hypothetical protein